MTSYTNHTPHSKPSIFNYHIVNKTLNSKTHIWHTIVWKEILTKEPVSILLRDLIGIEINCASFIRYVFTRNLMRYFINRNILTVESISICSPFMFTRNLFLAISVWFFIHFLVFRSQEDFFQLLFICSKWHFVSAEVAPVTQEVMFLLENNFFLPFRSCSIFISFFSAIWSNFSIKLQSCFALVNQINSTHHLVLALNTFNWWCSTKPIC